MMKTKLPFLTILFVLLLNMNGFSQNFGCNIKIDAANEYVNIGNKSGYYGATLTVEARIKATSWRSNIYEGSVLSCGTWIGGESGWDLRAAQNGNLSFNYSNGIDPWREVKTTNSPMIANIWYHVAATFNNGVVKIYINGVQVATQTYAGNIAPATSNLFIGTCPAAVDRNFKGNIDEVRVWNTALDATTLLAWHNQELTPTHPNYANIVAYFPFTNESANDASGNLNHGTKSATVDYADCPVSCPAITNLQVQNITTTSANVSWTAGASETAWNVIVSPTVITDFATATSVATTNNAYSATSLSPGTNYHVYVQANCGVGDVSAWSSSSFTTPVRCPVPTSIVFSDIAATTASFSWTAGASETAWNIIVSPTVITDFATATSIVTTTNPYLATALSPETTYYVYVQANCGVGDVSNWSSSSITTSVSCPVPTNVDFSDITATSASISWTAGASETAWNIIVSPTVITDFATATSVAATTNPYAVTGLSPQTTYYVYVQANCGVGDVSTMSVQSSFITACAPVTTLPFIENFNTWGTGMDAFPDCWTRPIINYGFPACDDSEFLSSPTSLRFASLTTEPTYVVTPAFAEGIHNLRVSFSLKAENIINSGIIQVGVMSNSNDISTFELVETIIPTTSDWTSYEIYLTHTALSGANNYIAFRHVSNNSDWYFWMDDLSVDLLPSCPKPTLLFSDSITSSTAVLHWVENGAATQWNIKVSHNPIDPATTLGDYELITHTGNPSKHFQNLDFGTTCYCYVQSICGVGDTSNWSVQTVFATDCDGISAFPWSEDFEGSNSPELPSCWSQINNNSDGAFWVTNPFRIDNPNALFLSTHSTAGNNDDYIVLPKLVLTGNEQLSFSVASFTQSNPNDYRVVLSTTGKNPADFNVELRPLTVANSNMMTQINPIDLSSYSGEVYIAIHVPAGGLVGDILVVDNFKVETIPSCPRPKNLFADNVTTTSAKLNWIETGTATSWNLKVSTTPIDPNMTTAQFEMSSTASFYNIAANALNPSTTYYWYVQANCGSNDLSPWSLQGVFSTECNEFSVFPFEENFDGDWNSWCWSTVDADSNGGTWNQNRIFITPRSGNSTAHGMGNNNDYLITPKLVINSASYFASWWDIVESSSMNNTYDVLVSTTDKSITSFTHNLGTFNCTNMAWVNHILDLSAFNGDTIYIAFHQTYSAATNYGFGIDDFSVREKSNENNIITFGFAQQTGSAIINAVNHTVTVELAMGTDRSALVPIFTTSDFATVDFGSGVARDFVTPVTYNVTSQLGTTQAWIVNTSLATSLSSANDILAFTLQEQTGPATIDAVNHTVAVEIEWIADITYLSPLVSVSYLASVDPLSGDIQDFSTPITYTVTAEDGTDQEWIVTVTQAATPLGANCSNPIVVAQSALPYSEIGGSTCGMGNDYSTTILNQFDNGEDIIYRLDLTQEEKIEISFTTNSPLAGVAIFNGCPDTASTIDYSSRTGYGTQTLNAILPAGSYYIMIDNFPGINPCIANYELTIRTAPKAINVIDLNSIVENISVCSGTNSATAIGQLVEQIVITDIEDVEYTVNLAWNIVGYDANTPAVYIAKGTFVLPEGVMQRILPLALEVTADVTVKALPVVTCPAGFTVTEQTLVTLTGALPADGTYSGTGVTGTSFNPTTLADGDYTISYAYTDPVTQCANSCDFVISVDVENSIPVTETANIGIYPNPNKGMFTLNFGTINDNVNYIIYDTKGSVLLNKNIQATGNTMEEVSLNLVSGVYFVKVITTNQTVVEKLVIE